MNTADEQVIEMANRPRERQEKIERQAKLAKHRRELRRQERENERRRKANVIYRLLWVAAVSEAAIAAVGIVFLVMAA